ncbi:hypothetical protein PanWU01x14_004440 [Parasponia andersonii]|uniref:Uncharacterized protein n=1 Tax=Parasponia andersonii TaxID=3476 RepID=A0A2P5E370_PARAD|nr:hypothetical protein PanWU01x14_004440 [Parasponia andersonii]
MVHMVESSHFWGPEGLLIEAQSETNMNAGLVAVSLANKTQNDSKDKTGGDIRSNGALLKPAHWVCGHVAGVMEGTNLMIFYSTGRKLRN